MSFLINTVREALTDREKEIKREAQAFQYYFDIECACRMLLDMKKKESEVKELLHQYFDINNYSVLDEIVEKIKKESKAK